MRYYYKLQESTGTWVEVKALQAEYERAGGQFGYSVGISDEKVVVAEPFVMREMDYSKYSIDPITNETFYNESYANYTNQGVLHSFDFGPSFCGNWSEIPDRERNCTGAYEGAQCSVDCDEPAEGGEEVCVTMTWECGVDGFWYILRYNFPGKLNNHRRIN